MFCSPTPYSGLVKLGSFQCHSGATTEKKCDSRAKLLFVNINIYFLPFSLLLPSPLVLLSSRNSATMVT